MFKKVFIHFRRTIKIVSVVSLGALLIFGAVSFIYKPIYSVSLNGEFIGYCANKMCIRDRYAGLEIIE